MFIDHCSLKRDIRDLRCLRTMSIVISAVRSPATALTIASYLAIRDILISCVMRLCAACYAVACNVLLCAVASNLVLLLDTCLWPQVEDARYRYESAILKYESVSVI